MLSSSWCMLTHWCCACWCMDARASHMLSCYPHSYASVLSIGTSTSYALKHPWMAGYQHAVLVPVALHVSVYVSSVLSLASPLLSLHACAPMPVPSLCLCSVLSCSHTHATPSQDISWPPTHTKTPRATHPHLRWSVEALSRSLDTNTRACAG